ncbi:MAG: amidohydrolase family protein [Myxococcota bacterium]
MGLDLKIVGGVVIDGSGAAGVRADVGVRDGRIVAVGKITERADRIIDAEGAVVTPGFIDLHTHYDGQATWDEELAPSSLHGVTTAVMGNCGVGFAPVRPGDEDRLIALMEGVEDIPGSALAEGLDWRWQSFPDYMDALDAMKHTLDLMVHVPHDPLRMSVMGERAVADEPATAEDIAQMRAVLREAMEAGAIGFSTGRTENHRTSAGHNTPASEARRDELVGLASALNGLDYGVLQAVSDFDMTVSPDRFAPEFTLLEDMALASGGHSLSMTVLQRIRDTEQWRTILDSIEDANRRGISLRGQVAPRPIGVLLGLEATFHPFMGHPSYKAISHLPRAARVRQMKDPAFRARILSEKPEPVAGDGSAIPPLADQVLARMAEASMLMFPLKLPIAYEPEPQSSLGMKAALSGTDPLGVLYDAMLEDDGEALIYFALFNYISMNLDVVHTMLTHPLTLVGLSDGGAHVGTICDASFPTTLLTWWGRDRPKHRFSIEQVVHMLTGAQAGYLGLTDRGVIRPGMRADLNVINHDQLSLQKPKLYADLPAGGKRLLQGARGYRATLVGGVQILENDALTDARPGRLVRMGR